MDTLLQLLERDALVGTDKLAKMLQISVDEVKKRIAKLEVDGLVLGYKAILNQEKLSKDRVHAVIEVRVSPERDGGFDRVAERISQFDEVKSCFLMSGAYDLLIFVEGRTLQEVASFVASKLSTLEKVHSTATHFMLKTYKDQGVLMARASVPERMSVSP